MNIQNAIYKVARNVGLPGNEGLYECKLALSSALNWMAGRVLISDLLITDHLIPLVGLTRPYNLPANLHTLVTESVSFLSSNLDYRLKAGKLGKTDNPRSFIVKGKQIEVNEFTLTGGSIRLDYYKSPDLQLLQNSVEFPYPTLESWAILYASAQMVAPTDTGKFNTFIAAAGVEEKMVISHYAGGQTYE